MDLMSVACTARTFMTDSFRHSRFHRAFRLPGRISASSTEHRITAPKTFRVYLAQGRNGRCESLSVVAKGLYAYAEVDSGGEQVVALHS